jgi:hypothetical protein
MHYSIYMNTAVETVKASPLIQELTGVGREFLLSSDGVWIRAEFQDGKLVRIPSKDGNTEDTALAA